MTVYRANEIRTNRLSLRGTKCRGNLKDQPFTKRFPRQCEHWLGMTTRFVRIEFTKVNSYLQQKEGAAGPAAPLGILQ